MKFQTDPLRLRIALVGSILLLALIATPSVHANMIITPLYGSNLNADPNAATIKLAIEQAIGNYTTAFSDPISIRILFDTMTSGLGQSTTPFFTNVPYSTFRTALLADLKSSDDSAALNFDAIANGGLNPTTGGTNINIKTANVKALGFSLPDTGFVCHGTLGTNNVTNCDGQIQLNTTITSPGSPGSSGSYDLVVVAEHEMDEVLGLGSYLNSSFQGNGSVEDLFRWHSAGVRSYTTSAQTAFFSIDGGNTMLAQFDNQNDGGDWGDWQSNPRPGGTLPQVQDAFSTPGVHPALGVELRALDVVGYDLAVPEPGTLVMLAGGLFFLGMARRA